MPTLEAITISNFRSIRGTIAIPLDAPIVILYGANGAGKTTVMSALELALTGEVAQLPGVDRQHFIHHGAGAAGVELTTSAGAVSFGLASSGVRGSALLGEGDARFFTERCYLAQRTLGELLEIYQSADGQRDSPLTRFVKELLRLDELDALLEGLDPVRDKRLVKGLVPEYAAAEREFNERRALVDRSSTDLKAVAADADARQTVLGDALAELGAPLAARDDLEPEGAAETWLDAMDEENALVAMMSTRRELAGLRRRWSELTPSRAARDSAAAEAGDRVARDAANAWWGTHGRVLEALLDELRSDFPGLPAAVASADPAVIHRVAVANVTAELDRLRETIAGDDRAVSETERLDGAVANAQARISAIDERLASSETSGAAEELGRVLAALIPHVHDADCPVCGRDYREISSQPLSVHLMTRVSELGQQAEHLTSLAKARLEAVDDLRGSQDARDVFAGSRMETGQKLAEMAKVARLEDAQRRLAALAGGVLEGAHVIRRAMEAERVRALAHREDRAAAELRAEATTVALSLGLSPVDDAMTLGDAITWLDGHVASGIAGIESREALRRTARKHLHELSKLRLGQRGLADSVGEEKAALARIAQAVKDLERRRERMKTLRVEAEASRIRIIRQVFNSSLNRMWRDLFVRLAPGEDFVPAFRVPESTSERVAANLMTVHRDGEPGGSPGAMLSAGNLNTAALTLFLALHLSAESRLPWLMLDDPVQSMDEVHISQFAALLRTLSKQHGRRVVIAVHEHPLFEYLALELSPAQEGDSLITVELSRSRDGASIARPEFFTYEEDAALMVA